MSQNYLVNQTAINQIELWPRRRSRGIIFKVTISLLSEEGHQVQTVQALLFKVEHTSSVAKILASTLSGAKPRIAHY